MNNINREQFATEYVEKVVQVKRVSKKTRGGNQISFTALVVSGDRKSKVGVGLGKAKSVANAISKGVKRAKKVMIDLNLVNGTIPHAIKVKFNAALILLRPGKAGSGLITGGPIRSVVELAGIKNLVSKRIGSSNKSVNVWATFKALSYFVKRTTS